MDTWVIEIIKQVPALAVLAYVVREFLKAQTEMRTELRQISTACHEVQQASVEATRQTTETLAYLVEAIRDCPGAS